MIKEEEALEDPLKGMQEVAFERVKDQINVLDWSEMQELAAGILRAMGYKMLVSSTGVGRGKDIIASSNSFGLGPLRIIVDVRHRIVRIRNNEIRSF